MTVFRQIDGRVVFPPSDNIPYDLVSPAPIPPPGPISTPLPTHSSKGTKASQTGIGHTESRKLFSARLQTLRTRSVRASPFCRKEWTPACTLPGEDSNSLAARVRRPRERDQCPCYGATAHSALMRLGHVLASSRLRCVTERAWQAPCGAEGGQRKVGKDGRWC